MLAALVLLNCTETQCMVPGDPSNCYNPHCSMMEEEEEEAEEEEEEKL